MQERENFSNRFAVVMAMAGSAIGLGNIWRFPYTVGEGGGAAFIIVYLLASIFLSLPIFFSEAIIGRHTHKGALASIRTLAPGSFWAKIAFLPLCTAIILLSYYSVVGGWAVDYFGKAITVQFASADPAQIQGLFGSFVSSTWGPIVCHTLFMGATGFIVYFGVKTGIERFSKITMPLLFVLMLAMVVYSVSLPGARAGVEYLVHPDFSKLTPRIVCSAIGQTFFSLSLGVGTILTYYSYVSSEESILRTGFFTIVFDLFFALIAGFAVMPAVFAAGIEPGSGPGLVFETLPYIFSTMTSQIPWLGSFVALLFFLTILVAALSSSISVLETCVAVLVDHHGISRGKAVVIVGGICWVIGCVCALSFGPLRDFRILGLDFFSLCDKLVSNVLMIMGGLMFTLFVGWQMNKERVRREFTCEGRDKASSRLFGLTYFLIRYVAPVTILVIFASNLIF